VKQKILEKNLKTSSFLCYASSFQKNHNEIIKVAQFAKKWQFGQSETMGTATQLKVNKLHALLDSTKIWQLALKIVFH
jgi:hypothetical protein